jgi:hypothetical protein
MHPHMKQRERLSNRVGFGSSLNLEANPTIECNRCVILLVHVDSGRTEFDDGVFCKPPTHTYATAARMNKKRFDLSFSHANKSNESTLEITHTQELSERE